MHELFRPLGGVDLEIPPREPMREPPGFDWGGAHRWRFGGFANAVIACVAAGWSGWLRHVRWCRPGLSALFL